MTTFFSVDVETSALDPWHGELLTVGIHVVEHDPLTKRTRLSDAHCYVRINRYKELEERSAKGLWGNEANPNSSFGWWQRQNKAARDDAYADPTLPRLNALNAAEVISAFCVSIQPIAKERVFVANPVSFDHMWLKALFSETGVEDPFHYQSLCLRSMKFGLREGTSWGSERDNALPEIPHHALHDARAQAIDLVNMLIERDGK